MYIFYQLRLQLEDEVTNDDGYILRPLNVSMPCLVCSSLVLDASANL